MSEAVYCLLSYCSELDNKSQDINSLVYLIFDQICELANKYPAKIKYREEIEVLAFRILLRPFADSCEDEEEIIDEEEKEESKEENTATSDTPATVSKNKVAKKMNVISNDINISN